MRWIAYALLFALLAPPAAAQMVRGALTEEGSRMPLQGVLVTLIPADGPVDSRAGGLTGRDGTFALRAEPGRWRLRAERIGYRSVTSAPFELGPETDFFVPLEAPVEAIGLEAVEVTAAPRGCGAAGDGDATARLWEEARKALESALWGRDALVRFEALVYDRRLDPGSLEVLDEATELRRATGERPFTTLDPEAFADGGFVQPTDSGTYYFAPDERVLLSDTFLAGHCFSAADSEADPDLVGLAFEPLSDGDLADIQGVLWLERETRELRYLEYRYHNLRLDVPTRRLGGRVDFQRLPGGAWFARRWWIRMPVVEVRQTRRLGVPVEDRGLRAIQERGGEVVAIQTRNAGRIVELDRPRLQGIVFDSTRGAPLAGADVALEGTTWSTTSDDDGRFTLAAAEGDYRVTFRHPRLDTLGHQPEAAPVALRQGVVRELRLAVPSFETLLAARCDTGPGHGAVVGTVRDSALQGLPEARVRVAWRSVAGVVGRREGVSDAEGRFAVCDVPPAFLRLRALHGGHTSEIALLQLTDGAVARAELRVDTLASARLSGRLRDAATGQPVARASVHVRETGLVTLTGEDGEFSFAEVPPGLLGLEITHVSYGSRSERLRVDPGASLSVDVTVERDAIELSPITVTAERRYRTPGLAGYYQRLEQRGGQFITAEQIAERQSRRLDHILLAVPGLSIACGEQDVLGTNCRMQFERARSSLPTTTGGSMACPIQFFIDGSPAAQEMAELIRTENIEGIEVYNGHADVPPRFRRGHATRCGVIAIWLKSGGGVNP